MNILLTNIWMIHYSGTETYTRDLSLELAGNGHRVAVYTLWIGQSGKDLQQQGILVTDDLSAIPFQPDIIHAHHNITTLRAIRKFPGVPVLYLLHDSSSPFDRAPLHRNILQYAAVDLNCKHRYVDECGFDREEIAVYLNWVDTRRFQLKEKIADRPAKALVFSNFVQEENFFSTIREACNETGIKAEMLGFMAGNALSKPETVLGNYDIIFAKAKGALEAMACGAAVIVCDYRGLGEMVTPENMHHYRQYNFGMRLMTRKIEKDLLVNEIKKYDPEAVKRVSGYIIEDAAFLKTYKRLTGEYERLIREFSHGKRGIHEADYVNRIQIRIGSSGKMLLAYLQTRRPGLLRLILQVKRFLRKWKILPSKMYRSV